MADLNTIRSKRRVDDLVQKFVRERLLPPKKPAKKNAPPPNLQTLHLALSELSAAKTSGLGVLFTSKEDLVKRNKMKAMGKMECESLDGVQVMKGAKLAHI